MEGNRTPGIVKLVVSLSILVFLIFSQGILVVLIHPADAVPSGPSNFGYIFDIEKTVYNPGDTVIITITNGYLQDPKAIVTIKSGMGSDNFENAQTLYREEMHLDNGTAVFKYEIPFSGGFMTEPIYRYYVEASGGILMAVT